MNGVESLDHPIFTEIDRQFARLLARLSDNHDPALMLAAALASWSQRHGNICLDLNAVRNGFLTKTGASEMSLEVPALDAWLSGLRKCSVVGKPGEFKPLILDEKNRLYLQRSWQYESELACSIGGRATAVVEVDHAWLEEALARYFPGCCDGETDWQRTAAAVAMRKKLCVITGGPGTGKTRTVAVLLAMLLEHAGATALRIALAAPTGKAAARLQESIQSAKATLPCSEELKARLPAEAFTLHRLLGASPGSGRFKHNESSPLPFDVVVIDEASMVDLALMAKLFQALPVAARVILLGDKDQLASVEAGAVLGDICHGARSGIGDGTGRAGVSFEAPALSACLVHLERNYRFGADSGLLALSRAVNNGDSERALEILCHPNGAASGIRSIQLPSATRLKEKLRGTVLSGFHQVLTVPDAKAALEALGHFRILCALRQGPFGVEAMNLMVEEILAEANLIRRSERWYAGRPIMVLQNDYNLRLFNGDVGMVFPDPESGQMRVIFLDANGELRRLAPARLPQHETVFAMTVHKSQGSEFEHVLLMLPDRESPILTRELIYTGLTRASRSVELWLAEPVFRAALSRRIERASGLRDALWEAGRKVPEPRAGLRESRQRS
jgi:exodeoxyribonuclease V alpha subunit